MIRYWIMLSEVLGRGSIKLQSVLSAFGNPKSLFEAPPDKIRRCGIFSDKEIRIINKLPLDYSCEVIENCKRAGIEIITPDSKAYPTRLFNISNPPCVLYAKGRLPEFDNEVAVTVVGARKATRTGIKSAASLAARLATAGCVIVTGAARGIDCAGLEGAMAAYGRAVCVVPCGIDADYPADTLLQRKNLLKSGGCIISECPPKTPYSKGAFHLRNRILSALSLATVVIEAGERSGALITAGCALSQGRDIFVIPGPVGLPEYIGSNMLLRDGARPLLSADDILLEYVSLYPHKLNLIEAHKPFGEDILRRLAPIIGKPERTVERPAADDLTNKKGPEKPHKTYDLSGVSPTAAKVMETLAAGPANADALADVTGLPVGDILSALVELEIFGYVMALPGGRYEAV